MENRWVNDPEIAAILSADPIMPREPDKEQLAKQHPLTAAVAAFLMPLQTVGRTGALSMDGHSATTYLRVTRRSVPALLELINDFAWHFDANGFDVRLEGGIVHATHRSTGTEIFFVFHERGFETTNFTLWLVSNDFGYGPRVWAGTPSATLSERLPLIVQQAVIVAAALAITNRRDAAHEQVRQAEEERRVAAKAAKKERALQNKAFLDAARKWSDLQYLRAFRTEFASRASITISDAVANLDQAIADTEQEMSVLLGKCGLSGDNQRRSGR